MFINRINVRRRVAVASITVSVILFILTTPISTLFIDLINSPRKLENVEFIRSAEAIDITWNEVEESDIDKIVLNYNDQSIDINKDATSYRIEQIDPNQDYDLNLQVRDITGRSSEISKNITVLKSNINETYFVNIREEDRGKTIGIVSRTIMLCIAIFIFSLWITQYRFRGAKKFMVTLYPSITLIPYTLITLSFLYSETEAFNKFLLSFLFALIFSVVSYLLFLTMNILNTSLYVNLPLEQAAKAAQFVFSLVSTYLVLILFFGGEYGILEKILLISPFVMYFSLSSIAMLKGLSVHQAIVRSLCITLTMIFSIFVISTWPVSYIFGMISCAVIFYVLLSISLEVRYKVTRYVWIEYSFLLVLVFILLVTNSTWGINGGII